MNLEEFVALAASRCDSDLTNYGLAAIDRHHCPVYFAEMKRLAATILEFQPRYASLSVAMGKFRDGPLPQEWSNLLARSLKAMQQTTRTDEHFQFLYRAAPKTPTLKIY